MILFFKLILLAVSHSVKYFITPPVTYYNEIPPGERDKITNVTIRFFEEISANLSLYHEDDIQRIRNNTWTVERFILLKENEDDALNALIEAMRWRKSFGVNDRTDHYFPKEMYELELLQINGKDLNGILLLWMRGKNHFKSEWAQLEKEFFVHIIDKIDRQTSHRGYAWVTDASGCGFSNVDMDFAKFMVSLDNYFPRGQKYNLLVDLPWILSAVAKIVISLMSEEVQNSMKFISKSELTDYVSIDNIPLYLGGNFDTNLTKIPEGVKSISEMPQLGFTEDQIKSIYKTYKHILSPNEI